MATKISENTEVQVSLKTLAGITALIGTLRAMWFTLQKDIAEAKKLPEPTRPKNKQNRV